MARKANHMKLILYVLSCAAYICCAMGGDTIPSELVGEWAPKSAVFHGNRLASGCVLCVNTNGAAAVVLEPGPIVFKWVATYDDRDSILTIREAPNATLKGTNINRMKYNSRTKTLDHFYTGETLRRREASPPRDLLALMQ